MGIKPLFTRSSIAQEFKLIQQRHDEALLRGLNRVGLQFVIDARSSDTYKDQTGNLRSSIGYIILHNGKELKSDFTQAGAGSDKTTGKAAGEAIAAEVAAKYSKGFVLIVVAGMNYAAAVEAMGYDVLTNSAFKAEAAVKKMQLSLTKLSI